MSSRCPDRAACLGAARHVHHHALPHTNHEIVVPSIAEFLREPHRFASLHCLYPYADPVTNDAHMKELALNDGTTFTEVRGDNKVAYCHITAAGNVNPLPSDGSPLASYSRDEQLLVMRVTYQPAADAVPCYYLPWKLNQLMRMKLKPSPKHPARGPGQQILQPELFVTAALQGCSVMVSGTADQPVVAHANAQRILGPGGEAFGGLGGAHALAVQAKEQHMKDLHTRTRIGSPKEGPKIGGAYQDPIAQGYTVGGAHAREYMSAVDPTFESRVKKLYWSRFRPKAKPYRDGKPQISVEQYGTVFGVRNAGDWKFYRQSRTRVTYKSQATDEFVSEWVDPVCTRFWP